MTTNYGPTLTTPATFRSLDEAIHASGAPTDSYVGLEFAQRDRWLNHYLRASFADGFPLNQAGAGLAIPYVKALRPTLVGPWSFDGTPGVSSATWYLRAQWAAGLTVYVTPFVLWPDGQQTWLPAGSPWRQTYTGAALGAAQTLTIHAPAVPGPCEIGFFVESTLDATSSTTGAVHYAGDNTVIDASGAGFGSVGVGWAIRLYHPGPTRYLSAYSDVRAVTQFAVANDQIETTEPLLEPGISYGAAAGIYWEAQQAAQVNLYAASFYEEP